MNEGLVATRRTVTFRVGDKTRPDHVDILVNTHRVWSTALPNPEESGRVRLHWPAALTPYLRGCARIAVQDSATGEPIALADVQIGRTATSIAVQDGHGRWLAVNKWQRMGPSLDADESGMRERLIARSKILTDQLEELGYTVYITGGTLLGAYRAADLLPNDDDTDLAILLEHAHPSDLSLDSFRLEDQLTDLGYVVVRHSDAHLQVTFLYETGEIDHYIDIFSAFYRDGEYCQPFHIRSAVPRSSIIPLRSMELAGESFPAPAVPADWFVSCYGPDWETPDPSFHFVTPLATRRRYDSWFGSLNMNRMYWESEYGQVDEPRRADGDARHLRDLSRRLPQKAPMVDLGCGIAVNAAVIAGHGHEVIGVDYSYRALALARRFAPAVDTRYANLYDRRRLLQFGAELVRSGRPWHFTLNHVLEGVTAQGRENVFLFLRLVLSGNAFAFASFDTNFSTRHYRGDKPETWHLPVDWLRDEATRQGIGVDIVSTGARRTRYGRRTTATAVLRRERKSFDRG